MVELLVAVAIIAILAAVALPQYRYFRIRTERTATLALFDSFGQAQRAFFAANDEFAPGAKAMGGTVSGFAGLVTSLRDDTFTTLGIPIPSELYASKVYRLRNIQYVVFGDPNNCINKGFPNDGSKVCCYSLRACSDKDDSGGNPLFCWGNDDEYIVFGNTNHIWPNTPTTGPTDGYAFLKYDDLMNAYLY